MADAAARNGFARPLPRDELAGTLGRANLGNAVANLGDANGDGVPDLLMGARWGNLYGYGAAFVVFGVRESNVVDLAKLGRRGYRIDGATMGDQAGVSVAAVPDTNGDGRDDALVGALYAHSSGAAWLVRSPMV